MSSSQISAREYLDIYRNPAAHKVSLKHLDLFIGDEEFQAGADRLRNTTLQIPPFKPMEDWVYENIRLDDKKTTRPGQMRLTVYQREVARCINDPTVRQIVVSKGVQTGYSKFIKALYAYSVSYLAVKVAIVNSTKPDAERYYKDEIAPMFKEVKALRKLIRQPLKGDVQDTWYEQRFANGAQSYFRGAFTDDAFRSYTTWLNIGDEVDADGWQPKAHSIGSKIEMFRDRGTDFYDSKLLIGGTMGLTHRSIINAQFLLGDQRRLHISCPHCASQQELRWGQKKDANGNRPRYGFRWDIDENGFVVPGSTHYVCDSENECKITQEEKYDIIENGVFIRTNPKARPGFVSIHWPSWISFSPGADWDVIAQQWVSAQGKPEELKRFVNNILAETWDDIESQELDATAAAVFCKPYPAEVPADVIFLTAGIDMQSNKEGSLEEVIASREVTITGWTRYRMPRVIGHWIIQGEPGDQRADAELKALLTRQFTRTDGKKKAVVSFAHDMGSTSVGYGELVKSFCASFPSSSNAWAIKGDNITKGKRKAKVFPKKPTRGKSKGLPFYMVDTGSAKDAVARMFFVKTSDGPMFPQSMPFGYFDKLMCEHRVLQKNGGYWWTNKKGRRSEEEWDCLIYSYVAFCGLMEKYTSLSDLNLAARTDGIPDEAYDPETGELLNVSLPYSGPDRSAQAQPVLPEVPAEPYPTKEQKANKDAVPEVSPVVPQEPPQQHVQRVNKPARGPQRGSRFR